MPCNESSHSAPVTTSSSNTIYKSILLHHVASMCLSVNPEITLQLSADGHELTIVVPEASLADLKFPTNDPSHDQKLSLIEANVLLSEDNDLNARLAGISDILVRRFVISDFKEHSAGNKYHSPFASLIKGKSIPEVADDLSQLSEGSRNTFGKVKKFLFVFENGCTFDGFWEGKCKVPSFPV